MTVIHKKQIVLGALVLMVGFAGYLNWKYEGKTDIKSASVAENTEKRENLGSAEFVSSGDDYFLNCKNNRETVRSKALEILRTTVESPSTTQETKEKAEADILEITKNIEAEGNIENLIAAKGLSEAVVFINNDCVTVTIRSSGLTAPEIAKIKDIILEETKNNNIKIVEVK